MATLYRYRTALTGFPGGPGVSTMYFLDQQTALASVRSFWVSMLGMMPSPMTAQVENFGDIIESTTGALTGSWSKPAVAPVVGGSPGAYSAPSGLVVNWLTGGIVNGRRLRGRTFVVPLAGSLYEPNGSLQQGAIDLAKTTADSLIFEQSLSLVVWARPALARAATPTSPARAARLGSHALVTASRVPDKVVVLRSRRD